MSLVQLRENLKYLREVNGYTFQALSAMLNKKSHESARCWETGRAIPQTVDLVLLSHLYDVTINDLVRKKK